MERPTLMAVYTLPPAYADNAVYKHMFDVAALALQRQLGDLDAAWLDSSEVEQIRQLPFPAITRLLTDGAHATDERTRVSSEKLPKRRKSVASAATIDWALSLAEPKGLHDAAVAYMQNGRALVWCLGFM